MYWILCLAIKNPVAELRGFLLIFIYSVTKLRLGEYDPLRLNLKYSHWTNTFEVALYAVTQDAIDENLVPGDAWAHL